MYKSQLLRELEPKKYQKTPLKPVGVSFFIVCDFMNATSASHFFENCCLFMISFILFSSFFCKSMHQWSCHMPYNFDGVLRCFLCISKSLKGHGWGMRNEKLFLCDVIYLCCIWAIPKSMLS